MGKTKYYYELALQTLGEGDAFSRHLFIDFALAHVVMFFVFGRKYNPGLIISILLNIPVGIYTVYYFLSNGLVTPTVNIVSIIVGILAQASMMIYGFGFLKPKMTDEDRI